MLRLIANELLGQLTKNATADWHKREDATARMRIFVKRILKKYGYPSDLAEDAVKLVLEQAEVLLRQVQETGALLKTAEKSNFSQSFASFNLSLRVSVRSQQRQLTHTVMSQCCPERFWK